MTEVVSVAPTILSLLGPMTNVEADPNIIAALSPSTTSDWKPSATRTAILLDLINGFSGMKSLVARVGVGAGAGAGGIDKSASGSAGGLERMDRLGSQLGASLNERGRASEREG